MISLKDTQLEKELGKIKGISFQEIRVDDGDLFEAVILNTSLDGLTKSLEGTFGKAKYPAGALPVEVEAKIETYGGIRGNQVLYFMKREDCYLFVMLWPWQDGQHITLKIFCG